MIARNGSESATALMNWLGALVLLLAMQGAHGAPIFKCVDASGVVSFQDTACAKHAAQAQVEVRQQPLIDPAAPPHVADVSRAPLHGRTHDRMHPNGRARVPSHRSREAREPVSYECRASDGEVFYRHSKCPASVPGDGVARFGFEQPRTNSRRGRRSSRGGAWGAVSVTSREVPREEACRKINAAGADGRDGHARDEQVSVYDHNLGRDPCSGG